MKCYEPYQQKKIEKIRSEQALYLRCLETLERIIDLDIPFSHKEFADMVGIRATAFSLFLCRCPRFTRIFRLYKSLRLDEYVRQKVFDNKAHCLKARRGLLENPDFILILCRIANESPPLQPDLQYNQYIEAAAWI